MKVQPHPEYEPLRRAFERLVSRGHVVKWSGKLYRSATPRYAASNDMVTGAGSRMNGGRWNAKETFHAVYGSMNPELAMTECLAHNRRFIIPEWKAMPRVFRALTIKVSRVADLTDGRVRQALRMSADRMIQDAWWLSQADGAESLTQAVGRAAFNAGLEGLIVPSAVSPNEANMVVFPANLHSHSLLRAEA